MTRKQKEEELIFKLFNDNYSSFPDSIVSHKDKPDFWVKNGKWNIGIEVTKVFQDSHTSNSGSKIKEGESLHAQIANNVQRILAEKHPNNHLWIDLSFRTYSVSPSRFQALVESISKIIEEHIHVIDSSKSFDHFTIKDYNILPAELFDINILFYEKTERTYVYGSGGGWIPNATKELLSSVVNKKNKLIKSYTKFDEYWLLIAEGMTFASYLDKCESFLLSDLLTDFSKVFLVRLLNQEVVQLK